MRNLKFNETQAFIFGYLKGNVEGIYAVKYPEPTKKAQAEWDKLTEFSYKMYDEICHNMGIPDTIEESFKIDIEELETEIDEIMQVYVKKINKQLELQGKRV